MAYNKALPTYLIGGLNLANILHRFCCMFLSVYKVKKYILIDNSHQPQRVCVLNLFQVCLHFATHLSLLSEASWTVKRAET